MPLVEKKDKINGVHYHFSSCKKFDNQFGNRLATIYGIKMIAYAINVPFTFICRMIKVPIGAAYLMQLNSLEPGPVPRRDGMEYSAEEAWQRFSQGVFPHYTYINLLEQAMQEKGHLFKIGIVTAPFKGDKLRVLPDKAYTSLSELIVTHLIAAIKHEFPEAEASQQPPELDHRVLSAHSASSKGCHTSTFCPYALLARENLGFMYKPVGGQNVWVHNAAISHKDFRLFETPMLNGLVISNNKYWLHKQDPIVRNIDIIQGPIFRFKDKVTKVVTQEREQETKPFVFDPRTVEGKSFEDAEGLQGDGTYLLLHEEFHQGPSGTCTPFVEQKDLIKRLNSDQPGPAPNRNGVQHSVEDVCHECDGLICGWTKMNLDL
ncbi:LOW QUALITY PROTEIN: hypothetical protein ACHAWO_008992 [Cyclotella atomus]|uniref:Uncharacterized protein n=1 Tax=Cyclotella atomus TaxID=382360 RepID=A0ABD3Q7T7_9STRA